MDTVELIMQVENHFGIAITDNEAEHIRTVQDLADDVARHLGKPMDEQIKNEVLIIVSDKTGVALEKIKMQDRIVNDLGLD